MIVFIIFSHYSTRVSNKRAMHSVQILVSLILTKLIISVVVHLKLVLLFFAKSNYAYLPADTRQQSELHC